MHPDVIGDPQNAPLTSVPQKRHKLYFDLASYEGPFDIFDTFELKPVNPLYILPVFLHIFWTSIAIYFWIQCLRHLDLRDRQ